MTVDFKQALVLAAVGGLLLGALIAFLAELQTEREFDDHVWQPGPEAPPPADVTALLEEACQIARDAARDA